MADASLTACACRHGAFITSRAASVDQARESNQVTYLQPLRECAAEHASDVRLFAPGMSARRDSRDLDRAPLISAFDDQRAR
jgi:hypothetical protein